MCGLCSLVMCLVTFSSETLTTLFTLELPEQVQRFRIYVVAARTAPASQPGTYCHLVPLLCRSNLFVVNADKITPPFLKPPWWTEVVKLDFLVMWWSGIHATCPSHSSLHLVNFVVTASRSPHRVLCRWEMCRSHCCFLVMLSTAQMQQ